MRPANGLNQHATLYITFTLTPILFSFVIIPISFVHYEGCNHCDRVIYTGEPVRRGMAYEGYGVCRVPALTGGALVGSESILFQR